ncbi:hypothetical protein [Membranihabitans marinus]|uniref:hypothetical protein n=1 Tax=Membranihabitans marinus TaxID=1227546 RepID=UPI001F1EC3E0|nr:hypothetical protein [Membranihabitans marinus]
MKYCITFILTTIISLSAIGQKTLVPKIDTTRFILNFDIKNERLIIPSNTIYFKKNKAYIIAIPNINNSYLELKSEIEHFQYLSSTPSQLKFIFPKSSSEVFSDHLTIVDKTSLYPTSIDIYANQFAELMELDHKIYQKTKWKSDPTWADETITAYLRKMPITSIDDIPNYFQAAKEYLLIAETHEKSQITKWKSSDDPIEILLQKYAKIRTINAHVQSLPITSIYHHLKASQQLRQGLTSPVYVATEDESKISLTLYDSYINDTISHHNLNVYTYGDIDLDFSIGLFHSNLYQNHYYLEDRDSLNQDIKEETVPNINIAFGALAHLSYHIAPKLKFGICLGTALTAFDEGLQYLLGGSIILGRQKQLVISGGFSFAQLDQLSASVKKDSQGPYLSMDESSIPLIQKGKTGYFLGISYNLIQIKKL